MALQPFTAVEHPAHRLRPRGDCHAVDGLEGLHRADLIGDWTDTTDARGHIDDVLRVATDQKLFIQPWWLVDLQAQRVDLSGADAEIQRAFAFHPREHRDADIDAALLAHGAFSQRCAASRNTAL